MARINHIVILFAMISFNISLMPFLAAALEVESIPIVEEIDLPEDLNFTVNNICSGHAYFMQATADKTGRFAVYTRLYSPSEDGFRKVFIDIYDVDGSFLQELTFETPLDVAVEIAEEVVNIYFYKSILVYDFETQDVHHYAIPDGVAVDGGIYQKLRSKEFVIGNWKYICTKAFDGYTKLTRSDGNHVQVLVEMPGTGNSFGNLFLPSIVVGIIGIAIISRLYKKKQHKTD